MSEQATNSPHDAAVTAIENAFLAREGLPPQGQGQEQPPQGRARNADGTFAKAENQTEENPAGAEQQGAEAQGEPQGQEPAQGVQAQPEEVEVDIDGEKYLVPKKISERFIQHADYTRKTQDLAELRRVATAEREAISLERAFAQASAQERDHLALLDAQIGQFKHVNWGAIEDTGQLIRLREQLNQLKDQRAGVENAIRAKRGQFDERIKSVRQGAMQAGLKYIQQNIKGYDQKLQDALNDYGRSQGYSDGEMKAVMDPRFVVLAWKARQWDELKAAQPGVLNRAASAAPVVRPGATQKTVSRVQAAAASIKKATTQKGKQQATEDYLAAKFGER